MRSFSRVAKAAGLKDFQTGNEALDRRYLIRGMPESEVIRVLSSTNLCQALLDAPAMQLRLEDGQINLQKRGVLTNVETLTTLLDLVVVLATVVELVKVH